MNKHKFELLYLALGLEKAIGAPKIRWHFSHLLSIGSPSTWILSIPSNLLTEIFLESDPLVISSKFWSTQSSSFSISEFLEASSLSNFSTILSSFLSRFICRSKNPYASRSFAVSNTWFSNTIARDFCSWKIFVRTRLDLGTRCLLSYITYTIIIGEKPGACASVTQIFDSQGTFVCHVGCQDQ